MLYWYLTQDPCVAPPFNLVHCNCTSTGSQTHLDHIAGFPPRFSWTCPWAKILQVHHHCLFIWLISEVAVLVDLVAEMPRQTLETH